MENLGKATLYTISLFGHSITFNPITFIMTYLVMAIFVVLAYFGTRNLKLIPGVAQSIFELVYEFLKDISVSTLGEKDGNKYTPFLVTLFLFVLLSNWIGVLPNIIGLLGAIIALAHKALGGSVEIVYNSLFNIKLNVDPSTWYSFLVGFGGFEEPTKSVNTDLGLAILVFILVQAYGIRNKGFLTYIRSFVDEPFPMKGPLIILFPLNPFLYLNIIGNVANLVSHAFRLFGNIFGGGMIIVIGSTLLKYFLAPVGLLAFFGLFAGLVQAFVFTMLAVTYIQQQQ